ncbi:MAG: MBL fold metallo-hydrolase [Lachnospiraceae bacterium]|nr:MBL fold metallo-hydrolase [Lachnospiraceae bacterium]
MQENSYKKSARAPWIAVICTVLLIALCVFAIFYQRYFNSAEAQGAAAITVHFIDVGQGDATLIICDGEAMLIDAGSTSASDAVTSYIRRQGVNSFKYVIATHPDEDHIGSMDDVLSKWNCETFIASPTENDTYSYAQILEVCEKKSLAITPPVLGETYSLGRATFTVIGPGEITPDTSINDSSVAVLLKCGTCSWLFAGDAGSAEEEFMLSSGADLNCDVYKVSHHGSSSSSGEEFLSAMSPAYAVISCGRDNDYDHPHDVTLRRLKACGATVLRTDEEGTIICYSDGSAIWWNTEPELRFQFSEK